MQDAYTRPEKCAQKCANDIVHGQAQDFSLVEAPAMLKHDGKHGETHVMPHEDAQSMSPITEQPPGATTMNKNAASTSPRKDFDSAVQRQDDMKHAEALSHEKILAPGGKKTAPEEEELAPELKAGRHHQHPCNVSTVTVVMPDGEVHSVRHRDKLSKCAYEL
jgi:hypothetical protein